MDFAPDSLINLNFSLEMRTSMCFVFNLLAISIEDLLYRKSVDAIPELLSKNITNFTICVTGAGGSIGSELCRQIIKQKPSKLVLLDNNEYALYLINQELNEICPSKTLLKPVLMNAVNQIELEQLFKNEKVDRIFHSAAYKHVPLVEHNLAEGVKNNVFGTLEIALASLRTGVSDFVDLTRHLR